jgi:hypothetical protein
MIGMNCEILNQNEELSVEVLLCFAFAVCGGPSSQEDVIIPLFKGGNSTLYRCNNKF